MALFDSELLNDLYDDGSPRRRKKSLLSPAEEASLLNEIVGGIGSAVGAAGAVIDTPWSFLRTALDKGLGQATESIFDTSKRTSGRGLLESANLIGRNTPGLDIGDVLGVGVEVADPFTALLGGGVTKAGAVAKDIGKFPTRHVFDVGTGALETGKRAARRGSLGTVLEDVDDTTINLARHAARKRGVSLDALRNEPMQRSIGVGLPFMENLATLDLPGAGMRAGLLDKVGSTIRKSWLGREPARMLDAGVMDQTSLIGQETAKRYTERVNPATARTEANVLRMHQELEATGVSDHDTRANLLERFHPDAGQRTLTPEEAIYRNIARLPDEDVATYEARTRPALEVIKRQMDSLDVDFDEGVKRGFYTGYEKSAEGYNPREATWPEYAGAQWGKARSKDLANLARTQVDDVLLDPAIQKLARQLDEDPLSIEALSRPLSKRVSEELGNLGYEDIDDVVDWQADVMRNQQPREAWNAVAGQKQALQPLKDSDPEAYRRAVAGLVRPDLSRTAAYKARINRDVQNQLREKIVTEKLGGKQEDWLSMPRWRDEAGTLPDLRRELDEVSAGAGDVVPIDRQIVDATEQLRQAEGDLTAYRSRKADLDMRDIFSRTKEESFDIERLTPDELQQLETLQDRAMKATPALRERYDINRRLAGGQLDQAVKDSKRSDTLAARADDATTKRGVQRRAQADAARNESTIRGRLNAGTDLEREAAELKAVLDDADGATNELAALEAGYRQRGYFTGESPFLGDDEVRELAGLRGSADRLGYLRAKIKRLEERRANGNFQPNVADRIDVLNDDIGRAELARANLRAMDLKIKQADVLMERARDVPAEALDKRHSLYGNDPLFDLKAKLVQGVERRAMFDQSMDTLAANVDSAGGGDPTKTVSVEQALDALTYGKGNATKRSAVLRQLATMMHKHGKLDDEVFQNIAGPRAVATSAMRSDKVVAEAMRTEDIVRLGEKLRAGVAAGKVTGADAAKRLADLRNAPPPNVSAVGTIKRARETLAAEARKKADVSKAAGLLADDDHKVLLGQIASFERGKGFLSKEADEILAAVESANPIPNDGLLQVRNWRVPKEVVEALQGVKAFHHDAVDPKTLGGVLDRWRTITKAHFTLPWPAFHNRNIQGMAMFYASVGAKDPRHGTLRGIVQPAIDMARILKGKGLADAEDMPVYKAMGLKGKDAEWQLLADLSAAGGLRGAGQVIGTEGIEATFFGGVKEHDWGTKAADLSANIPGGRPIDRRYFTEPFTKARERIAAEPKGRAMGVLKEATSKAIVPGEFVPTAIGGRISNYLENLGRGAAMIGLLRQGKSVDEAAALMKAAFVDYENLSKWERSYARRLIPFWTFQRKAIPYAFQQFIEKPGGIYGQTARLANSMQQDTGFTPPQVGGSLAVPIGQERHGLQRFLSQLDTPAESINRLVVPSSTIGRTVENSLRSVIAQTDPLVKGLLEVGFGKSSFQGRNLEDLDPFLGRVAGQVVGSEEPLWRRGSASGLAGLADSAVSSLPTSRYVSSLRTSLDGRKGIMGRVVNLTSGAKLTDVDMDAARGIAGTGALKELLKDQGARQHVDVSFTKDDLAKMPPEQRQEAMKVQAVLDSLRRQRKERQKAVK